MYTIPEGMLFDLAGTEMYWPDFGVWAIDSGTNETAAKIANNNKFKAIKPPRDVVLFVRSMRN